MGTPRFLLLDHLKEEDVPHFFQGQPSAALTFPPNYGRILMYTGWCFGELCVMERIKTLETRDMCESAKNGGCGECQTSCQSACKTSCGVANQKCENTEK